MLARTKLTPEENEFYRTMLYRVKSNMDVGQPALEKAFDALVPVSVLGSGTMSCDQFWRVYIDFDNMMHNGLDYACGILNHEIWHILRQHVERVNELPPAPQGYDKNMLANIAEDLEINDDIEDLLPANSLMPERNTFRKLPKFKDRIFYYKWLLENLEEIEKDVAGSKTAGPFPEEASEPAEKGRKRGRPAGSEPAG